MVVHVVLIEFLESLFLMRNSMTETPLFPMEISDMSSIKLYKKIRRSILEQLCIYVYLNVMIFKIIFIEKF